MKVVFYDEGMYLSGSANGQVVAGHPELASLGLALVTRMQTGDEVLASVGEDTLVACSSGGTISNRCREHGIVLMGHPGESDDIEQERYLHIPGQDRGYRLAAPERGRTSGVHSAMAKCSAGAVRLTHGREYPAAGGHRQSGESLWKWPRPLWIVISLYLAPGT